MGVMEFPTTKWSLLGSLRDQQQATRESAVAEIMGIYWKPLYAFLRCHHSKEESEDIVQGFFARCLEKQVFEGADQSEGKFRSYLLRCLQNFAMNEDRSARAKMRQPAAGVVSVEQLILAAGPAAEPIAGETPESAFLRVWRKSLLDAALARYAQQCQELNLESRYQLFFCRVIEPHLNDTPRPTFGSLAPEFRLSENAANKAVLTAIAEFRQVVERMIRRSAASEAEVDEDATTVLMDIGLA